MSFDVSDLLSGVITQSDVSDMLRELDTLQNSLYKSGELSFVNTLDNGVNINLSNVIKEEIKNSQCNNNLEEIKNIITNVKSQLNNLEVIKLEIGVKPTSSMIKTIYQWIKNNTEKEKIIDIVVDKDIIGGARITFKGNYTDLTLNKKWQEIWEKVSDKKDIKHQNT